MICERNGKHMVFEKPCEFHRQPKTIDMDRAEELSWIKYPDDNQAVQRHHFRKGYRQAEKGLIKKAVTWWSNNLAESEPTKGHHISAFNKYMKNK